MSESRYTSMRDSIELTSIANDADTIPLRNHDNLALGKPRAKALLDNIDALAMLVSIASLIVSVCVIIPDWRLSWQLGYGRQLIVIGFLLSIMNLCLKRVAPTLFLILEARWGHSHLQNYDSLMRNAITLSHTRLVWRVVLLALILLPIGLSAAYKTFRGGHSTVNISPRYSGYYGVASPPLGNYNVLNNSIYFAINASAPFLAASANDSIPLPLEFPQAYGFNTLLLSNTSAALLDVPVPDYVLSIQQNLSDSESWKLSAPVNATFAKFDDSFVGYQDNDTFWNNLFENDRGIGGLTTFQLYQPANMDLGMMVRLGGGGPEGPPLHSPSCLLGYYSGLVQGSGTFKDLNTSAGSDTDNFRKSSPLKFDVHREVCMGTWEITMNDFRLVEGFCPSNPINVQELYQTYPFYPDALPVLVHSIGAFSPVGPRNSSHWRIPAIVNSVATMYWARLTLVNPYGSPDYLSNNNLYYPASNETRSSTKSTLNDHWLLYLVLAVQPILTIGMSLFALFLYEIPIDNGFGLAAILAGVDRDSLDVLDGAALSGELRRPVTLGITVHKDEGQDGAIERVRYSVGRGSGHRATLRRKTKYK